jgi:nucleotide-binding universal stress UspA family protein
MGEDTRPIVVSFDGSTQSATALEVAVAELPGRHLVIVSVWEPAFTTAMLTPTDAAVMSSVSQPGPREVATIDRVQRGQATAVAEAGVAMAQRLGATAEPMAERDDTGVAETVVAAAERCDAALIVVGSRGLGTVKSWLLGSTTRRLLHESRRPVLVVRSGDT